MTTEELITLINESQIAESEKPQWVARVQAEGVNFALIEDLKAVIQASVDEGFRALGIDISDTPEYKEREAQMVEEVKAAKAEFDATMDQIDADTKNAQIQASQKMDDLKVQAIKAGMDA